MQQVGDYAEDYADLNFEFVTNAATGAPTILAGSPVVSVYKSNDTGTEKTSAETYITLSIDFDGLTGSNHVKIDLSGDAFFEIGKDYRVKITTGTVDSVSVVGYVVAHFSIENRFDEVAVTSMATDVITAAALKADAVTEIATGVWAKTATELSGKPAQTDTFRDKLEWIWTILSNKKTQNATTATLFKDDASTPMSTAAVSTDGTTITFGEWSE